jgi:hypothetical protein
MEEGMQIMWSDEHPPNANRSIQRSCDPDSKFNRESDLRAKKQLSQRIRISAEIVTVAAIPKNAINEVRVMSRRK